MVILVHADCIILTIIWRK